MIKYDDGKNEGWEILKEMISTSWRKTPMVWKMWMFVFYAISTIGILLFFLALVKYVFF